MATTRRVVHNNQDLVLVIVGATGSGKTGLGIAAAKWLKEQLGVVAEIISADSRAIYRGMNIGTAKPSAEEQQMVRHWGIDLVNPDERFTAKDFQLYARKKIRAIQARGNEAMVVGGTGLYVDALVYDYQFGDDVKKTCSDRQEMCAMYKIIGIDWTRDELRERLKQRTNKIFSQEIESEAQALSARYGWDLPAMSADIYPILRDMLAGRISRDEAMCLNTVKDSQLAKRQCTWFKRNKNIVWIRPNEAIDWISNFYLDKYKNV